MNDMNDYLFRTKKQAYNMHKAYVALEMGSHEIRTAPMSHKKANTPKYAFVHFHHFFRLCLFFKLYPPHPVNISEEYNVIR